MPVPVLIQVAHSPAPGSMRFHYILGNHLIKAGRLEEVVASLRSAIELGNYQSRVRRSVASTLAKLGDTGGAIAAIKSAIGNSQSLAQTTAFVEISWCNRAVLRRLQSPSDRQLRWPEVRHFTNLRCVRPWQSVAKRVTDVTKAVSLITGNLLFEKRTQSRAERWDT